MRKLTATISHAIPGRLRVYLSAAPKDVGRFTESILGHAGLESVEFTELTRAVLVRFDPRQVTSEEVVMRIALALSVSMGDIPATILKSPESDILTNGAAVTGILTGTTFLLRWLLGTAQGQTLQRIAAMGTGAVVLQHGWREIRARGYFDPEVLSLAYLVTAVLRGDYARGALITWMLVFGRHLLTSLPQGVEIRPMQRESEPGEPGRYELVVAPGSSQRAPLFSVLQSLARYLAVAGGADHSGLLNELRAVSNAHGEMLDGLGWMRHDIPMHFG